MLDLFIIIVQCLMQNESSETFRVDIIYFKKDPLLKTKCKKKQKKKFNFRHTERYNMFHLHQDHEIFPDALR